MSNIMTNTLNDLDVPIEWPESRISWLKKGKLRVIIHFEDRSHKDYFVKLGVAYTVSIKKRMYVLVPECISMGKNPTIEYYFNNPWPIKFVHEISKVKPGDLWNKEESKFINPDLLSILADVRLDAETLQAWFNSNWLKSMYSKPGLTIKNIILIAGVIIVGILVVLQVTGVVDVVGFFTGAAPGG